MNDIIVPAERLAELLKAEHELKVLNLCGVGDWEKHYEALMQGPPAPNSHVLDVCSFDMMINEYLENGTLAAEFGFEENGDSEVNVVIDDAGDNFCVGE